MSSSVLLRRHLAPSGALAVFFLSGFFFFSAPELRAQSDDSQDVAEAARQERARKQNSSSKHVYTNEDLRRSKILTQEDQTRAATNRKQSAAPSAAPNQPSSEPLDANSNTPQEPLGEVARRYRDARRDEEKNSPFRLPTRQPELASPKILPPALRPLVKSTPKIFDPSSPKPTLHHNISPAAPTLPPVAKHRVDPFSRPRFEPTRPADPIEPRVSVKPYAAPIPLPRSATPTSSPAQSVVIQRGDTLWSLSRQHLGRGTRWLELMAVNPTLADPSRLVPGTSLVLPAATSAHHTRPGSVTVHAGDTLSAIALTAYGHASYWPCIVRANPLLDNPNRLEIGELIQLPASCQP